LIQLKKANQFPIKNDSNIIKNINEISYNKLIFQLLESFNTLIKIETIRKNQNNRNKFSI